MAVPRAAKSAATLITLGADQIHMGLLGELGPIDPQLGDLPALGVKRALETIASVCQQYPRSAEAFSLYMSKRLTVEQIGYCERVVESAVQYAERLLANKPFLKQRANFIAKQLVYEYKHHGFVIDLDEARGLLGESWILKDSIELAFAEKVYQFFDVLSIFADTRQDKTLLVIGDLSTGVTTYDKE